MKQILVEVDKTGAVKIETKGYSGCGCVNDANFLKLALGKETDMEPTAEFYNGTGQKTTIKNTLKT